MATFKQIAPGHPFVYGQDGVVMAINEVWVKDAKPIVEGARSGTASSFWITSLKDSKLSLLPTGEPDREFNNDQSVVELMFHLMPD